MWGITNNVSWSFVHASTENSIDWFFEFKIDIGSIYFLMHMLQSLEKWIEISWVFQEKCFLYVERSDIAFDFS